MKNRFLSLLALVSILIVSCERGIECETTNPITQTGVIETLWNGHTADVDTVVLVIGETNCNGLQIKAGSVYSEISQVYDYHREVVNTDTEIRTWYTSRGRVVLRSTYPQLKHIDLVWSDYRFTFFN